ncbi:GntR family transcriptional regulator [Geminisphaera colitermitum]|uniref:GntR family transcriptional regulator n=1 Tax=Geminisphaera colitermitum TaxID=1148786 RepID=UPI0009E02FF9|nr:GntR family transcriptional regulator [Geminisphaera colitermitum]
MTPDAATTTTSDAPSAFAPPASQTKLKAVYDILENRITSGIWPVGTQIPTEMELADELECGRSTIGKALAWLAHEGWVERKTRAGTRVLRSSPGKSAPALSLDACAFIYPSDQHEGIRRIMTGFQTAAHRARRQTVMLSTGTDFRREAEAVGRLGEFDVKGAVLLPVVLTPKDYVYYAQMLLSCRFPIVLVTMSMTAMRRPGVVLDGFHAGHTMTRHLLEKGLRKVGFLANQAWIPVAQAKHTGYSRAMEEAGLADVASALAHRDAEMQPNFGDPLAEPERIARLYLQRHPDVEGVVCASDFLAVGMIRAARALGREVPRDLKVVGIDDFEIAATAPVPLTTYRVPFEQMGEHSFDLLNNLLGDTPVPPLDIPLRGELVVRNSAG